MPPLDDEKAVFNVASRFQAVLWKVADLQRRLLREKEAHARRLASMRSRKKLMCSLTVVRSFHPACAYMSSLGKPLVSGLGSDAMRPGSCA